MSSVEVVDFYDRHPISDDQILASLQERGKAADSISPEDLFEFDQDHYGGVEAVEALARAAGVAPAGRVLDLCSGLGGPARYLAWRFGCRVTGIDLTPSRVAGARRLTELVGLTGLVTFVEGDATQLPFPGSSFSCCMSQEAFVHVAGKASLFAGCHRVLEPGGVLAFTDWVDRGSLEPSERRRLQTGFAASGLSTVEGYLAALSESGFSDVVVEDLSLEWARILHARLEMYRSLRRDTVARFGEAHYRGYEGNYAFFVELVEAGRLGGARVCAAR